MEADLFYETRRAVRLVLAKEFKLGFDSLATNDWNWVKENVLPLVKKELASLGESDSQLESLVRGHWGTAKAEKITQELSTEGLFDKVR